MGCNEPTEQAIAGTDQILRLVQQATARDVCLCLISGGASALLVRPSEGVSLADKQSLMRLLSAAGADIRELNLVRTQMSEVKGGGLTRCCHAGTIVTLVLSDVLGDPLDVIGSGPTVPSPPAYADACRVLEKYHVATQLPDLYDWLRAGRPIQITILNLRIRPWANHRRAVRHVLVGNLTLAMEAAAERARQLGYEVVVLPPGKPPSTADEEGMELAGQFVALCGRPKSLPRLRG